MSRLCNLNMLVAAVGMFGKGAACHAYTQLVEIVAAEKNKRGRKIVLVIVVIILTGVVFVLL